MNDYSNILSNYSSSYFIGLDEVGTGSLAGPIVVCGVKAHRDWTLEGLNDSKKLSAKKRGIMEEKLKELSDKGEINFFIAQGSVTDIDSLGLAKALKNTYATCIKDLYADNSAIFVDGTLNMAGYVSNPIYTFVKGDTYIPTIMAASILAKTFRDKMMHEYHNHFPNYDWLSNVGYGTAKHLAAIKQHGISDLHRKSFAPCNV